MKNRTIFLKQLKLDVAANPLPGPVHGRNRPKTRGECPTGPCPWVSCRYHLYLDVGRRGELVLNQPDKEPDELEEWCALDMAERGGMRLAEIGELLSVSREAVRQMEELAWKNMKPRAKRVARELEE